MNKDNELMFAVIIITAACLVLISGVYYLKYLKKVNESYYKENVIDQQIKETRQILDSLSEGKG